ncbi:MAG: signal recognition particle receptor subunit alpha, partial [Schleiferiaceae bacterium]
MSFFKKFFTKDKQETLDKGLEKTRSSVFEKITRAVAGKSKLDEEALDDIEEALITSDVGLDTTVKIIEALEERVARDKVMGDGEMMQMLYEIISELMSHESGAWEDFELPKTEGPYVLMVVGVNGVGKTTTIGKLAHQFKNKCYNTV